MLTADLTASSTVPADDVLLRRIAAGDNAALELLYNRYARVVYGLSLRMLGTPEAAEDIVQDTFWRVWKKSDTYQPGRGNVGPWITGIAHNLAIDELRRRKARPIPVYEDDEHPILRDLEDTQVNVADAALVREQQEVIRDALKDIPPDQREVIELSYFGGLSQQEIANRLQNPVGTVKTRARLALQKLRSLLQSQGYVVGPAEHNEA